MFSRTALGYTRWWCTASLCACSAGCYTTLDPTRLTGGAGGEGGATLPTCSFADAGTSRYTVCPSPLTYAAAAKDCELRDAHLVAIQSQEENDSVADIAFAVVNTNVWVGGTRTDDFVWSWPDGSIFWRGGRTGAAEGAAFVFFQSGEPNDSSTTTTDPERCLAMTVNENWNDRSCSLSVPYICEQEP